MKEGNFYEREPRISQTIEAVRLKVAADSGSVIIGIHGVKNKPEQNYLTEG